MVGLFVAVVVGFAAGCLSAFAWSAMRFLKRSGPR